MTTTDPWERVRELEEELSTTRARLRTALALEGRLRTRIANLKDELTKAKEREEAPDVSA